MKIIRNSSFAGALAFAGLLFSASAGTSVAAVSMVTASDAVAPVSSIEQARTKRSRMMKRSYRNRSMSSVGSNPAGTMTRSNRDGIKRSGADK